MNISQDKKINEIIKPNEVSSKDAFISSSNKEQIKSDKNKTKKRSISNHKNQNEKEITQKKKIYFDDDEISEKEKENHENQIQKDKNNLNDEPIVYKPTHYLETTDNINSLRINSTQNKKKSYKWKIIILLIVLASLLIISLALYFILKASKTQTTQLSISSTEILEMTQQNETSLITKPTAEELESSLATPIAQKQTSLINQQISEELESSLLSISFSTN